MFGSKRHLCFHSPFSYKSPRRKAHSSCPASSLPQRRSPGDGNSAGTPENKEERLTLFSLCHLSSRRKKCFVRKSKQIN